MRLGWSDSLNKVKGKTQRLTHRTALDAVLDKKKNGGDRREEKKKEKVVCRGLRSADGHVLSNQKNSIRTGRGEAQGVKRDRGRDAEKVSETEAK